MVKLFEEYIEARNKMEAVAVARECTGAAGRITNSEDVCATRYQMRRIEADVAAEEIFATLRTLDDLGGIEKFEALCALKIVPGVSDG